MSNRRDRVPQKFSQKIFYISRPSCRFKLCKFQTVLSSQPHNLPWFPLLQWLELQQTSQRHDEVKCNWFLCVRWPCNSLHGGITGCVVFSEPVSATTVNLVIFNGCNRLLLICVYWQWFPCLFNCLRRRIVSVKRTWTWINRNKLPPSSIWLQKPLWRSRSRPGNDVSIEMYCLAFVKDKLIFPFLFMAPIFKVLSCVWLAPH